MTDPEDSDRLAALQARIDAAKEAHAPKPHTPDPHSQAQLAWRMVIELVAGMAVGFAMGYGLDLLLGTKPWLMVVFLLLGFAAGVRAMIATAREMTAPERQEERD